MKKTVRSFLIELAIAAVFVSTLAFFVQLGWVRPTIFDSLGHFLLLSVIWLVGASIALRVLTIVLQKYNAKHAVALSQVRNEEKHT